MARAINLSGVNYSLPKHRTIFNELNLNFDLLRTGIVGRNGVGKSTLLRLICGELQPNSGTISVIGKMAVLRQSVQRDEHLTIADLFGVSAELALLQRIEQGLGTASDFSSADWTLETRIAAALGKLDLSFPADYCLTSMSGGQRSRAGIASLLFAEPDFLLLDEPTNNLDREGRKIVLDMLRGWTGGALVISHDRELLDSMDAIVELTSSGINSYGGNWGEYQSLKTRQTLAARRDLADAERGLAHLNQATQEKKERQSRRNRSGRRSAAKGGIPRILIGARKDRSERTTGEMNREADRIRQQLNRKLISARHRIELNDRLKVDLPSTNLPQSKTVLRITDVTYGFEADQPLFANFSMRMTGPERIALVGPNGSGKTTLIALITGSLLPWNGTLEVFCPFAVLDQSVGVLDADSTVRENFLRLNPQSTENECRAALARFKFPSDAALQLASTLSGGELLRAGLACVIGGPAPPPLLILDEPTNHLDLESLENIESGLEKYDGGLLVVSHDLSFLESISMTREVGLSVKRS